jgi:nitrite reductase/ring-hydroxylating ferredoxin subunit
MLGDDLVFFRGKDGQVRALADACPHRGASLSLGDCYWKGYISCPYHGATFDTNGTCVEFVTEGPESRMVGGPQARSYPTITLKGLVFVWMGDGKPVPPEEDIPPEYFDEEAVLQISWAYWQMNWEVALENVYDSHNCWWVHRNSLNMLGNPLGGRPRTPIGYRVRQIDNKVVCAIAGEDQGTEFYYADEKGDLPYQMYYPRVEGYWPLTKWRLLWSRFTYHGERRPGRSMERITGRRRPTTGFVNPEGWGGRGFTLRLPGMRRAGTGTRWCVPVDENLTRLCFSSPYWPTSLRHKLWMTVRWPYDNWKNQHNFQNQDREVAESVRLDVPEYLSSTDGLVAAFRKLVVEHGRGLGRHDEGPAESQAEKMVYEADRALGLTPGVEIVGD